MTNDILRIIMKLENGKGVRRVNLEGIDGLVTLGIAGFFIWHLLIWAIGYRAVKIIGIIIGAAFLYHIFGGDGRIDITEWWLVIGVAIGVLALKPNKKAGKKASR